MKYIVLECEISSDHKVEVPIIFPAALIHADVAKAMAHSIRFNHGWIAKAISAGELPSTGILGCHGKSETLNLKSRGAVDDRLLSLNDYGVGHV